MQFGSRDIANFVSVQINPFALGFSVVTDEIIFALVCAFLFNGGGEPGFLVRPVDFEACARFNGCGLDQSREVFGRVRVNFFRLLSVSDFVLLSVVRPRNGNNMTFAPSVFVLEPLESKELIRINNNKIKSG